MEELTQILYTAVKRAVVDAIAEAREDKQPDPLASYPEYITRAELAAILRITVRGVKYREKGGKLPAPIRMGKKVVFRKSEIIESLKKAKV